MKKFTPQVILIGLSCLFLLIFLLPQFSISLDYRAYKWEVESTDKDGKVVSTPINLITSDISELDLSKLKRSKEVKPGTINWVGLEFPLVGLESTLANFGKGSGIYPSFSFTYKAGAQVAVFFNQDVDLMRARLDAIGFTDVEITRTKTEKEWNVVLTFPAYYTQAQAQKIADLIMSPGKLQVFEADTEADTDKKDDKKNPTIADSIYEQLLPGFKPKETQIQLTDIASVRVVNRTDYAVPVWEVTFKQDSRELIYASLRRLGIEPELDTNTAGSVNPYANFPVFSLEFDRLPLVALIFQDDLKFIGVPLGIISTEEEMKAASSYFVSTTTLASGYSRTGTATEKNEYANQGRTMLAWFVIITFVVMIYTVFRKAKLTGIVAGTLGVAFPILIGLALAKVIATPISVGFVLSVMFSLAATVVGVYYLTTGTDLELGFRFKVFRDMSLLLALVCGILYLSGLGFGIYQEMLGVLGLMSMAGFIATWIGMKQVFIWFFE